MVTPKPAPVGWLCRFGIHRRERVNVMIAGRSMVNELWCKSCPARWMLVRKHTTGGDFGEFAERIN